LNAAITFNSSDTSGAVASCGLLTTDVSLEVIRLSSNPKAASVVANGAHGGCTTPFLSGFAALQKEFTLSA